MKADECDFDGNDKRKARERRGRGYPLPLCVVVKAGVIARLEKY